MVLVGEAEEQRFRQSRRSHIEVFAAAPVAGIQTYLKSFYDISGSMDLEYFSPFGQKRAPLRNTSLYNVIRQKRLLDDGKFNTFKVYPNQEGNHFDKSAKRWAWLPLTWLLLTWLCFGGILVLCRLPKARTWIGVTNCAVLTSWSITIRFIELRMFAKRQHKEGSGANDNTKGGNDGIFILGSNSSGIAFHGSRDDIKYWTTSRLDYEQTLAGMPERAWHHFIRLGTILVLTLIFCTLPNGSTTDQLAFVLLNVLGQMNVFLGLYLSVQTCLEKWLIRDIIPKDDSEVEKFPKACPQDWWTRTRNVKTRTDVYAKVIRYFMKFDEVKAGDWIDVSRMLPNTSVWDNWKRAILDPSNANEDAKALYSQAAANTNPQATDPTTAGDGVMMLVPLDQSGLYVSIQ